MDTIFEALRNDHDTQRKLVEQLLDTEGESEDRVAVYARLKAELEAHAAMEERFFYRPLMMHDPTQDKARHSVSEHKEIDDFLEQLDGYEMSGSQWLQTAEALEHRLTHHLDEEEHEVFQIAGKVLSDNDKTSLAADYEAGMNERRAVT